MLDHSVCLIFAHVVFLTVLSRNCWVVGAMSSCCSSFFLHKFWRNWKFFVLLLYFRTGQRLSASIITSETWKHHSVTQSVAPPRLCPHAFWLHDQVHGTRYVRSAFTTTLSSRSSISRTDARLMLIMCVREREREEGGVCGSAASAWGGFIG